MERIRKGPKKKKAFPGSVLWIMFFFSILCFFVFGRKREKRGGLAGGLGVGYRYLFLCFCLRGYEKRSTGSLLHAFTSLVRCASTWIRHSPHCSVIACNPSGPTIIHIVTFWFHTGSWAHLAFGLGLGLVQNQSLMDLFDDFFHYILFQILHNAFARFIFIYF